MKLLYLCHDLVPSPETRTEQLVRSMYALAAHGFETTLAVPTRQPAAAASRRLDEIRLFYGLDEAHVFPAGLVDLDTAVEPDSRLGRVLADVLAVRAARSGSWDLIYTRDLGVFASAVLSGMPTVFETYRADLRLPRFWPLRFCYRRPNLLGVVTHSRYSFDSFRDAGLDAARLHLGYNGHDPASLLPVRTRGEARVELGLASDAPLAVYTGHVEERKGTSFLLQVAALVPDVTFLMVGAVPGSRGERGFRAERERLGLENVRLVPRVPPPDVPAYLYAADCLVVPPTAAPLRRHRRTVLPMKIFSYMAAGRPILAPDLPDVREILRHGENAVLVRPDAPREAAAALTEILRDAGASAQLAQTARRDAQQYTWAARAERLAEFLHERHRAWQAVRSHAS